MTIYQDFFHAYFQLGRQLTKNINERLIELGIYSSQWTIIYYLKKHESVSQADLCRYLNVEAPTMTRTIARLEKAGWILKVPGKDKREKQLVLTDEAHNQYPKWKEAINKFELEIMKGIYENDLNGATKVFQQMTDNAKI